MNAGSTSIRLVNPCSESKINNVLGFIHVMIMEFEGSSVRTVRAGVFDDNTSNRLDKVICSIDGMVSIEFDGNFGDGKCPREILISPANEHESKLIRRRSRNVNRSVI